MSAGTAADKHFSNSFFAAPLTEADPEIAEAVAKELGRQQHEIELIASENIVSRAVLEAPGLGADQQVRRGLSGPPLLRRLPVRGHRRGDRHRARQAAVRLPASPTCSRIPAAQANQGVFLALMQPGDTFLGLDLAAGGHLTHGARPNVSGKWFKRGELHVRRRTSGSTWSEVERIARSTSRR
jgi:glycine hydroxymethyltransferase